MIYLYTAMDINIDQNTPKNQVFEKIGDILRDKGFNVEKIDQTRPWGGFFVIDESQSQKFIESFLNNIPEAKTQAAKISPKILVVAPHKRLSWQYHHRRAEVWKVVFGDVGVVISDTDEETSIQTKCKNDVIILSKGERHRLIGLEGWGVIAEIWQHTNANQPSDEDDIIRVQDDFGR